VLEAHEVAELGTLMRQLSEEGWSTFAVDRFNDYLKCFTPIAPLEPEELPSELAQSQTPAPLSGPVLLRATVEEPARASNGAFLEAAASVEASKRRFQEERLRPKSELPPNSQPSLLPVCASRYTARLYCYNIGRM
jgi:hypothetical protein